MITLVIIEGFDGTGKSKHRDEIVRCLRASHGDVRPFSHGPFPPGLRPYGIEATTWMATTRMRALLDASASGHPVVIVADRWDMSTRVFNEAYHGAPCPVGGEILRAERALEQSLGVVRVPVYLTDTPDDVADRRLLKRGEPLPEYRTELRRIYRREAMDGPVFDTSHAFSDIAARIIGHVKERLDAVCRE